MQLFYSTRIRGEQILLEAEENRHAVAVLRKTEGAELHVFDGRGNLFHTRMEKPGKHESVLRILDRQFHPARKQHLHLAIAPTKNSERIEWMLEKGIEMGLEEVTFVLTRHSERRKLNLERLHKIALAAAKQSLSLYLPLLRGPVEFTDFIHTRMESQRWIAVCDGAEHLLSTKSQLKEHLTILIGPEGDFSNEEYTLARGEGWTGLSLGAKRLRTETAALQAIAQVNLVWNG